jgi:hypothetical protein
MVQTTETWNNLPANGEVVISVPHMKVLKVKVRPVQIYLDKEVNTFEIGRTVAERCGVRLVVNNTLSDPNKADNYFDYDETNKRQYYEAIMLSKPKLVLDIHGTMDEGAMLFKPRNEGLRYFRQMQEDMVLGRRPDVDIELGRKHGFVSCKGALSVSLANFIAKKGFSVDFESVYPGGAIIKKVSGLHTDAMALEIARRVREDPVKMLKVSEAIGDFVDAYLAGKNPPDDLVEDNFIDSEQVLSQMQQAMGGNRPQQGNPIIG